MNHDLVVFVPGILGTRLTRDGKDLWNQSKQALLSLRSPRKVVDGLLLPPGIRDQAPDGPYALEADRLLKGPEALPGFLSCIGYPDVRAALGWNDGQVDQQLHPKQYLVFPYDWRLSNRLTAQRLKERLDSALDEWRSVAPGVYPEAHDDPPKVVLMCHSMGGLVARYYLECLGGREDARALVTLGTPFQGAAKAVRVLTGHALEPRNLATRAAQRVLSVNERLAALARSFPSVAQLLPFYECVVKEDGRRKRLNRVAVPDLPSELVREAFAFHDEINDAWDRYQVGLAAPPYRVHCFAGRAHPTVAGVVVGVDGGLTFPTRLDNDRDWGGDGTVPGGSAFASWVLEREDDALWNGERHAGMAGAEALRNQLMAIRRSRPARQMLAGDADFGLEAPEMAVEGEPFTVRASGPTVTGRTLRARLTAPGLPTSDAKPVTLLPDGTGEVVTELTAAEGTWVLEVEADRPYGVCHEVVTVAGV
ncbi:esterase/lipase family protein [Streptomyces sp. NPDC058217]|uniref:esterase/lipase family protein n=1 Tax=Streptomyces sp. NPDC058217 TaxID=3346384 RepID=UPI0036E572AE